MCNSWVVLGVVLFLDRFYCITLLEHCDIYYTGDKSRMNPPRPRKQVLPHLALGNGSRPIARPWERPKARAKARARARARASNGLMCMKEGRPNVMLKENSERKIAAPGNMTM